MSQPGRRGGSGRGAQEEAREAAPEPGVQALLGMPKLFQSLCDPMRIRILHELLQSGGPRTVSSIAAACPVDLSVVRHLRALAEVGVLTREKQGKEAFYRVEARALARTLRSVADAREACCGEPDPSKTEPRK